MSSADTVRKCGACGHVHPEGVPCDVVRRDAQEIGARVLQVRSGGTIFQVNRQLKKEPIFFKRAGSCCRTWLRNLPNLPTKWAMTWIRRQMRKDPGWAHSWHCNIAMPLYDALKPECACEPPAPEGLPGDHGPECIYGPERSMVLASHTAWRACTSEAVATRLMKNLFNAQNYQPKETNARDICQS